MLAFLRLCPPGRADVWWRSWHSLPGDRGTDLGLVAGAPPPGAATPRCLSGLDPEC